MSARALVATAWLAGLAAGIVPLQSQQQQLSPQSFSSDRDVQSSSDRDVMAAKLRDLYALEAQLRAQLDQPAQAQDKMPTEQGKKATEADRPDGPLALPEQAAQAREKEKETAEATTQAKLVALSKTQSGTGAASGEYCLSPPYIMEFGITNDNDLLPGIDTKKMVAEFQAEECGGGKLQWTTITTKPRDPDTTFLQPSGLPWAEMVLTDGRGNETAFREKYLGGCGVRPTLFSQAGAPTVCPPGLSYPEQLFAKLKSLFGTKDQLLTFEWPGRLLSEQEYHFDYVDAYSTFLKPVAIQEAEFRLADDLFPLSEITGGPSGSKLSTMYRLATNMLQESTEYPPQSFLDEKKKARKFLSTVVKHSNKTVMEFHQQYLDEFNEVTANWKGVLHQLKQKARVKGTAKEGGSTDNRDALADEIVMTNDQAQQAMNAAWKTLVVDGMHHEVMSALSVLDVESPGEMLQDAKNRLRNSGRTTLDGSETVYPVSFQPAYWSDLLTTAFSPVDLLMEPQEALSKMQVLMESRNALQDQITSFTQPQTGQEPSLKNTKDQAAANQTRAYETMLEKLGGDNDAAEMLLLYCAKDQCKGKQPQDLDSTVHTDLPFKLRVAPTQALVDAILAAVTAQEALLEATAQYQNWQQKKAMQESGTFESEVAKLRLRVVELTKELDELKSTYSAVVRQKGPNGGKFDDNKDFFPSMPKPGPWARVILTSQRSTDTKQSASRYMHTAESKTETKEKCSGWWFWKSCNTNTESSSSYRSSHSGSWESLSTSSEFSIAFEAAKVTINRGGWFKPEFLEHSDLFMKFGDKNISRGRPTDAEWDDPVKMVYYRNSLLPSYPVAFVLARDITIKIINKRDKSSQDWASDAQMKSDFRSWANGGDRGSSEGYMGFSANDKNIASKVEKDALVIKIAGAQIIMWIQNFISVDRAKMLAPRVGRPGYDVLADETGAESLLETHSKPAWDRLDRAVDSLESLLTTASGRSEQQQPALDSAASFGQQGGNKANLDSVRLLSQAGVASLLEEEQGWPTAPQPRQPGQARSKQQPNQDLGGSKQQTNQDLGDDPYHIR
eukprot:g75018.t1